MKLSKRIIKLNLPAQNAKMGGELGAMLGQHEINIVNFCKKFNKISLSYEKNMLIKVCVYVLDKGEFDIKIKGPSTNFLIKQFSVNNCLSWLNIYKIALIKKKEQPTETLILVKNVISTAISMKKIIKNDN